MCVHMCVRVCVGVYVHTVRHAKVHPPPPFRNASELRTTFLFSPGVSGSPDSKQVIR